MAPILATLAPKSSDTNIGALQEGRPPLTSQADRSSLRFALRAAGTGSRVALSRGRRPALSREVWLRRRRGYTVAAASLHYVGFVIL